MHQLCRKLCGSNLKLSPLQRCQIDSAMIIQITFCLSPYLILFFFFFPGQHLCLLLCVAPCQQTQNPIPVAHIKFKFTKTTLFSFFFFFLVVVVRFNAPSCFQRKSWPSYFMNPIMKKRQKQNLLFWVRYRFTVERFKTDLKLWTWQTRCGGKRT